MKFTTNILIISAIIVTIFHPGCKYPEEYVPVDETVDVEVMGIEIFLPSNKIMEAESIKADLLIIGKNGEKFPGNNEDIQWESSDSSIFIVNETGMITGIEQGRGKLHAYSGIYATEIEFEVEKPINFGSIRLSEIFYDAEGSDSGREFIEIYNGNDYKCDISNLKLIDGKTGSTPFDFPEGTVIDPGQYIVIASSHDVFYTEFEFYPHYWGFSFTLNNSGEAVFLMKNDGTIVDEVYIEGGTTDYPVPLSWGSESLPEAKEGFSVHRTGFPGSGTSSDWESGLPTPGGE